MNTLNRLLALAAVSATAAVSSHAGTYANISVLDNSFDDWAGVTATYTDPSGDGNPGDINQVFLANNETHFFIRVTFNTAVNPQSLGGFYIGVDNDSNAATGWNVYGAGIVGTEAGWQNDGAFEQAQGVFNTSAVTSGANAAISPYATVTTSQEISISRTGIIDTANNQLIFPGSSFTLALYFNGGTVDDITDIAIPYTFAAIPEPSSAAALAGLGVLGLVALRRRR